jgi:hypothetical protein
MSPLTGTPADNQASGVNARFTRPNRGKGGAIAQIDQLSKLLCSDRWTKRTRKELDNAPDDLPAGALAPPPAKRRASKVKVGNVKIKEVLTNKH